MIKKITRREAMLMSLGAAGCGLVGRGAAAWAADKPPSINPSLKSIGERFNYLVGIQAPFSMLQNPTTAQIVAEHFNLLTSQRDEMGCDPSSSGQVRFSRGRLERAICRRAW